MTKEATPEQIVSFLMGPQEHREHRGQIRRASWQKHKDVYLFAKKMRVNIPTARRIIAKLETTKRTRSPNHD